MKMVRKMIRKGRKDKKENGDKKKKKTGFKQIN